MSSERVAVYGAYGHTGQLVSQELRARGVRLTLIGRDPEKMRTLAVAHNEQKFCLTADAQAWAVALKNIDVLVNCAGPFADTAVPLIEAAIRVGIDYFDTTGEPAIVHSVSARFDQRAQRLGRMIAPATGFFGGLGDLLISAAAGDWRSADRIELDFILDGWNPTSGTLAAFARMGGRRLVYIDGELHEETGQPRFSESDYGPAFGCQRVIQGYPSPEAILVPRHLNAPTIAIGMGALALRNLRTPSLASPRIADNTGQRFLVEARVFHADNRRSIRCEGADIYATTALIVAEAVVRNKIRKGSGVLSLGTAFDAAEFLNALTRPALSDPHRISFNLNDQIEMSVPQ